MQDDSAVGIARPMRMFDVSVGGRADRVQRLDEVTFGFGRVEFLEHLGAHTGHDAHRAHDVRRVGELHADLGVRRVQRAHAERDHVHDPAAHAARETLADRPVRVLWAHPVTQLSLDRSTGHVHRVPPLTGAYERPALHPGHVPGTAPGQKTANAARR